MKYLLVRRYWSHVAEQGRLLWCPLGGWNKCLVLRLTLIFVTTKLRKVPCLFLNLCVRWDRVVKGLNRYWAVLLIKCYWWLLKKCYWCDSNINLCCVYNSNINLCCVYNSNIKVNKNELNNPSSTLEVATHSIDIAIVIDVSRNWWGSLTGGERVTDAEKDAYYTRIVGEALIFSCIATLLWWFWPSSNGVVTQQF